MGLGSGVLGLGWDKRDPITQGPNSKHQPPKGQGGRAWSKARGGQTFLKMDVAVLRLRQGFGAAGRGRAHSGRRRFRGLSISAEANRIDVKKAEVKWFDG